METTYRQCIDEIEQNGKYPEKGKRVVVIGAGVMGLCCAILSKIAGYEVEIYSDQFSPNTTSDIAGAFWKPFLSNEDSKLLDIAKENFRLCSLMLKNIEKENAPRVVDTIRGYEYSRSEMEPPQWKDFVVDFKRVAKEELPLDYKDGFYYQSILTDVPIYMKELNDTARKLNIPMHQYKVENFNEFLQKIHGNDLYAVLNCAGLGSRFIFKDNRTYPIAGQVVKIATKPQYHQKWFFFNNDMDKLAYVIMRSDCVVLGGSANENDWNQVPNEQFTKEIIRRCQEITPEEHVPKEPKILDVKVGLRPFRDRLRVEKEFYRVNSNGTEVKIPVIHNYGHSGSGWTLHLGSCKEALLLLRNARAQPKL